MNTVPPLNGGNGSGGTAFQLSTNSDIIVQSFNAALQSSSQNVEIWYSTTDLTGPPNITVTNGWTQLGTATVTGLSIGLTPVLQTLPINVNLVVPTGATYRFYIGCSSCSVVYTTFNGTNSFTNGTVTLTVGTNVGYGGSIPNPTFHPRQFNGGVNYVPNTGLDLSPTSIVAPVSLGVGNNTLTVRVSNTAADTVTQSDLSYSFNGGTPVVVNNFSFPSPLGPGDFYDYTFSSAFNVPSAGTYTLDTWVSDVNGLGPDDNVNNDTLSTSLCTGLSGTYTINSGQATAGTNYNNFVDAVSELIACGVNGPVTFNVANGTYTGQFTIGEIPGASSTNTITFQGDANNNANVNLTFGATTSTANYTVKLDGSDWVRFRDLTMSATGSIYSRIMDIGGEATNNEITGCRLIGDTLPTTTSINKVLLYSANGNDDNNTITDNLFHGGSYGVYLRGTGTTSLEEGLDLSDNVFLDWYYMGVYLWYHNNLDLKDNTFRTQSTYTSTSYGIYLWYGDGAQEVVGNQIERHANGVPRHGLYLVNCDANGGNPGLVANNGIVVGDSSTTNAHYGLYMSNCGFQNVVHNTVVTFGGGTGSRTVYIPSGGGYRTLNNNVVQYGTGTAFYLGSNFALVESDHNNLYAPNGETGFFSTGQTSLQDFQTASGLETNSFSVDPQFVDWPNNDLRICSSQLSGSGDDLQGLVGEDFEGDTRTQTAPDIGFDEFNSVEDFAFTSDSLVLCSGGSLVLTGATDGSSNSWSTGANSNSITVTATGSYSVTMTNSCASFTDTVTVVATTLAVTASVTSNVSCNGLADGTASASASGGEASYSYLWTTGATTASVSGLAAGSYQVTVTDALGCTVASSITVTEPTVLQASATVNSNISCSGGATGSATASGSGGTGPYNYAWSNSATTAQATGLAAGTYGVTVTDANGCVAVSAVAISQAPAVVAVATSTADVTCNGQADGSAAASAVGGTGPYTYAWSNGASTSSATGLAAGAYSVTITDATGCTAIASTSVTEPSALSMTVSALADVSCNGGNDGSALAQVAGGTAPYAYAWSNGGTAASATGLQAGTVNVTCTDAQGCTVTGSVSVSEPAALSLTPSVNDVDCPGGTDGSASVSVSGGTTPYVYNWSNAGAAGNSQANLSAGTYSVTVTDANNCSATDVLVVNTTNAAPTPNLGSDTTICTGASLQINGGGGVISYLWSTGSALSQITVSNPDIYWVEVTDINGCTARDTVQLFNWPDLQLSVTSQDAGCQNDDDGSATATLAGGAAPFAYTWNDPGNQTSATAANLANGSYTVTVVDDNGCSETAAVQVGFLYPEPVVDLGPANGVICEPYTYFLSPGAGFDTYQWSTGASTASIEVSTAGTYAVTATDLNGCSNADSIALTVDPCVGIGSVNDPINVQLFPNPSQGLVTLQILGLEGETMELSVFNLEGRLIQTERLTNLPGEFRQELNLSGHAAGVYTVRMVSGSRNMVKRVVLY